MIRSHLFGVFRSGNILVIRYSFKMVKNGHVIVIGIATILCLIYFTPALSGVLQFGLKPYFWDFCKDNVLTGIFKTYI